MPGAGKSTVAACLQKKGMALIVMGDVIRSLALKSNLKLSDRNLGKLMLDLRKEKGKGAIAYPVLDQIKKMLKPNGKIKSIIVDGIRNIEEVEILKSFGTVKVLAIHGSASTRFEHIKNRSREDAPVNLVRFKERDSRELKVGISKVIALADEAISNNEISLEELCKRSRKIVEAWIEV
jgi:dephospho-CoA kinase